MVLCAVQVILWVDTARGTLLTVTDGSVCCTGHSIGGHGVWHLANSDTWFCVMCRSFYGWTRRVAPC